MIFQRVLFKRSLRFASTSVFTHEHTLPPSLAEMERRKRRAENQARLAALDDGTGLVEKTLKEMETNPIESIPLTPEERKNKRRSLEGMPSFEAKVGHAITRKSTTIFQINIGIYCNQACGHCHVESSPRKVKEQMDRATVDRCIELIAKSPNVTTLDITGGAPELNRNFRYLVESIRKLPNGDRYDIIDRCNLTVLSEPGQDDLGEFLKRNRVHVIASLPCYGPKNVNEQRGSGVFDKSVAAILQLNELGYGSSNTGLVLDLVYNPIGPFLPPDQDDLEKQYKKVLDENFGIHFNKLFCITNMPIKRFADFLHRRGELRQYMDLLVNSYNPTTIDSVMCRDTLSVRYDGALFDCDFNQQLDLAMVGGKKNRLTVFDVDSAEDVANRKVATASHCFGCTAGRGSSCQGVVA